jgi:tetratricopeptide (TPR) repeat protein
VRKLIWLCIFGLVCLSAIGLGAESEQGEEVFFRANQAYKAGRFQEAIEGYHQLIQSGHGNGHVYYNLGNAHIRSGRLGEAILNYERARLVLPRDGDLDFNLRYARDQIRDVVPQSQSLLSMTFFWLKSLSPGELFWGFAIFNAAFWGILCVRIFYRSEWTYYLFIITLVFWLIAGVSFALKWYQIKTDDRAVILQGEVDILAGPDVKDTVLFKLHEGTLVHKERSEDGWSLIRLQDGKRGWVQSEAVQSITRNLRQEKRKPALNEHLN